MPKFSSTYSYTVVIFFVALLSACSTVKHSESVKALEKSGQQAPLETAPAKDLIYEVKDGDTLSSIARKKTGDSRNWITIAELNNISDPDTIIKGLVIVIPRELTRAGASVSTAKIASPAASPPDKQPQQVKTRRQDTVQPGDKASASPKPDVKPTPQQKRPGGWLIIRGTNFPREINIRPDTSSDILTQAWPGTRMQFIDRTDGWYKVITEKGHGYLNPDYVKVSP